MLLGTTQPPGVAHQCSSGTIQGASFYVSRVLRETLSLQQEKNRASHSAQDSMVVQFGCLPWSINKCMLLLAPCFPPPARVPFLLRKHTFIDLFPPISCYPADILYYPPLWECNIWLLAPMYHAIVSFGPVSSAFTASKGEDYGLDSFRTLLLRTMPCSPLNPVQGQHLMFPNKRDEL